MPLHGRDGLCDAAQNGDIGCVSPGFLSLGCEGSFIVIVVGMVIVIMVDMVVVAFVRGLYRRALLHN